MRFSEKQNREHCLTQLIQHNTQKEHGHFMRAVATLRSVETPTSLLSLLGQNEEKKTTLFCGVPVYLISKIPRVSQCDFLLCSFLCVLGIFVQNHQKLSVFFRTFRTIITLDDRKSANRIHYDNSS